jgi:GGDEF domain-containing protein
LYTDRVALLVLLAVVPSTASIYLISLVAPVAFGVALTAFVTAVLCGLLMFFHARRTKDEASSHHLISSLLERQVHRGKRLAIVDPETTLFKRWYFDLRLSEEILRCHRYGSSMTLLALERPCASGGDQTSEEDQDFVHVFMRNLRALDLATRVGDGEYCVCLSHTDKRGGEAVASRLLHGLGDTQVKVGIVEYDPANKLGGEFLIERAFAEAVPCSSWHPVQNEPPRADFRDIVERVRLQQAGSVPVGRDETVRGVKTRLRRAAKRSGVSLQLSERDGVVYFQRAMEENAAG